MSENHSAADRSSATLRSPWFRFLGWLLLYEALTVLGPYMPWQRTLWSESLSMVLFGVLAVSIALNATAIPTQLLPARLSVPLWVVCLAGWVGLRFLLPENASDTLRPLIDGLLIAITVWAGSGVASLIREAGLLAVVLGVSALVDVVGVTIGPVAHMVVNAPDLVSQMSVEAPTVGSTPDSAERIVSMVGIGDFLFLGLLFAAVRRFDLNLKGTAWWTICLMSLGLLTLIVVGLPLPGLVFICGAGLIANWRHFRFTGEEKQALMVAGVLFLVLMLLGVWWLIRYRSGSPPASEPAEPATISDQQSPDAVDGEDPSTALGAEGP